MQLQNLKARGVLCTLLCLAMLLSLPAGAAESLALTGAQAMVRTAMTVNGQSTDVIHTEYQLAKGSKYAPSSAGVLNVVEIPASSDTATLAVLNNGSYNWSRTTVGAAAVQYNDAHDNSTVLAAINACPWLLKTTDYDADHVTATGPAVKVGGTGMPMGTLMCDGELYNTDWMSDENRMDNTYYSDWEVGGRKCFVVTDSTTYAVTDSPEIRIAVENASKSTSLSADALNRLPAPNSLIVYNHRVYDQSLAFSDAYEVYLRCDDVAFRLGGTITGTVTHVFAGGDSSKRPAIDAHTIVLSARGAAISRLSGGGFAVGDAVTIKCSSTAKGSEHFYQIVGGFFTLIENGRYTGEPENTNVYPASIVGVRADGTALLISLTSGSDGKYHGARMKDLSALCEELGCVDALLFDGGGSATMVTLDGSAYVRRSSASDGQNSVRSVVNSLAAVALGVNAQATYKGGAREGIQASASAFAAVVNMVNDVGTDGTAATNFAGVTMTGQTRVSCVSLPQSFPIPNEKLRVYGWFIAQGGQRDEIYWSVDGGLSWQGQCTDIAWSDGTSAHADFARGYGVENPDVTHAIFQGATVDLAAYAGQTVDVTLGRAAATGEIIPFVTLMGASASHRYAFDCSGACADCGAPREGQAAHTYDHACDSDCNVCSEQRVPSAHTDADLNAACDVCGAAVALPPEPVTPDEDEEQPPQKDEDPADENGEGEHEKGTDADTDPERPQDTEAPPEPFAREDAPKGVLVSVIALACLGAAGVAVGVLYQRRTRKK